MSREVELPGEETETALEPVELIRQSGVILRTGTMLLSAGSGSYRVKRAMQQVAFALGLDRHEAHVTLTEITATAHRGPIFRTEVTETRAIGVNSDRIVELEEFTDSLPERVTIAEVEERLDQIAFKPPLYRMLVNALGAAVACAAFALLNNGGWVEWLGVFVGAFFGQLIRRYLSHLGINHFGVTMVSAATACGSYLAFVTALESLSIVDSAHEAGYVFAVLYLVPGFPLMTGALDLAKYDFSAGIARLTYAGMILLSAGVAVWGLSAVAGLSPQPLEPMQVSAHELILFKSLASFVGVFGFAIMFNSPLRTSLGAAGIGMVANTVRLIMLEQGMVDHAAVFFAALLIGLLAALLAGRLRTPRITLSVPAVIIMVPGSAAYRAIYHFNNENMTDAIANGASALLILLAMAVGLGVGRMLTEKRWAFE